MSALTGMGKAREALAAVASPGKLSMMALALIHPDPRNAILRDLDAKSPDAIEELKELTADIKANGIKSPLSLRPHPDKPGEWIINHGHRRFAGATAAGLLEVPYFVDENFTAYDQVKENLHRRNLTPWAFAEFIKSRLAAKEQKADIAAGLGKKQGFVTEHLALVDAPACLHIVYANGIKSPRTLYDLRRLWDEFPEQVEAWVDGGARVTRDTIMELGDRLRASAPPEAVTPLEPPELRHDAKREDRHAALQELVDQAQELDMGYGPPAQEPATVLRHDVKREPEQPAPPVAKLELRHDVKGPAPVVKQGAALGAAKPEPGRAIIMVEHRGRKATILPTSIVRIMPEGTTGPVEVALSELVVVGVK
jgi:ParB family chromosome partitioning protein